MNFNAKNLTDVGSKSNGRQWSQPMTSYGLIKYTQTHTCCIIHIITYGPHGGAGDV